MLIERNEDLALAALRVGLIGVGWGALVHAPAFGAVDGYELVALCSSRPESVASAGQRLGVADVSTDWASFVRRDDLDLISISTPVPYHHDMFSRLWKAAGTSCAKSRLPCPGPRDVP